MYSIVLMTALTTSPETPQFNGYFRDMLSGCHGCSGGARYSCSGGCSGTSYAQSCNGCNGCCGGGVFGLGLGDRVRRVFDPVGGCCGGGCCGGTSFASGCCGGTAYAYGCCGGIAHSYTPMFTGGLSCQGGLPMSAPPPIIYDNVPMVPGVPGNPNIPYAVPEPAAPGGVGYKPSFPAAVAGANGARANVTVRLPADAKLFAEGKQLNLTGGERQFVSPPLPVDQEFVYKFTAEYDRGGETVSVSKKVTVRAGSSATVEFTDLTASKPANGPAPTAPASIPASPASFDKTAKPTTAEPAKAAAVQGAPERATITVKLPQGASLYVDDRKSPSADPVRTFSTPALPQGREFAYVLKAEVTRNGQPETLTQKVPFRAGERVVVDFTSLGK